MNIPENNFLKYIKDGKHKGKRLYLEQFCGLDDMYPIEMYYLFQNAFKNNLRVFYFPCIPNNNILIPDYDINFLDKSIPYENREIYEKHKFSKEVLDVKNLQCNDLFKLYNLAVKYRFIKSIILIPNLYEKTYHYNFFLIVDNNFNLTHFLKLNLSLVKIKSSIEYYTNTLTFDFIFNIYNFSKINCKDYIVTPDEILTTIPYDIFKLKEKIELDNFLTFSTNVRKNNPNIDHPYLDEKIKDLKKKLRDKTDKLKNLDLYKEFHFKKLCYHLYIFDSVVLNDCMIFTNFLQISNGGILENSENGLVLNQTDFFYYSLEDMLDNDLYELYTVYLPIYQ